MFVVRSAVRWCLDTAPAAGPDRPDSPFCLGPRPPEPRAMVVYRALPCHGGRGFFFSAFFFASSTGVAPGYSATVHQKTSLA